EGGPGPLRQGGGARRVAGVARLGLAHLVGRVERLMHGIASASARQDDRHGSRELARMGHREVDRPGTDLLRPGGRRAGKADRRLRPADDLDLRPGESDAAAERLTDGLLARKARRVALRSVFLPVAVVLLRLGEAALAKAGALERLADPLDLDHVGADLHDGGACSNQSGNWASELTTTSGMTAVDSSCSGRNLPVRTSAVRMPKSWAPRTSASMSSVTSQVSSGSAPSASRAAAKHAGL